MSYRNCEGYSDPTAGAVISAMMREYRQRQRKRFSDRNRRKVYVVSRYAGDVSANVAAAVRYCRYVIDAGYMPLASHLLYPQMLDDGRPEEREMGLAFGLALLALCDEVWIFDDGRGLSDGMAAEEREARRLGKAVRRFGREVVS